MENGLSVLIYDYKNKIKPSKTKAMKNNKFLIFGMAIALLIGTIISCQKESNEPEATESEVAFEIKSSDLKNAATYELSNVDKIILTIQHKDGSPTSYSSSEINIQHMNGLYYTQKLIIQTGDYKLTEFLLLDASGNTIFAAPITGSLESQNVNQPLPIHFSVVKDVVTNISVEVLSTENKTPTDFGLVEFPIIEVRTFDFLIALLDDESGEILSGKLMVSRFTYLYVQDLDAILNNVATIKDGMSGYTLIVDKPGYNVYLHYFPINELKMYLNEDDNLPLVIVLKKKEGLTVADIDGNIYNTVQIGSQVWMAENLKVGHYANGTSIPMITDKAAWANLSDNNTDKGYCYYNNNIAYSALYGNLYTWAAAMNGSSSSNLNPSGVQGVCPTGWHVPSDAEWKEMEMALGMSQADADAMGWTRGTDQGSQLAGNADIWTNGVLEANSNFGTSGFMALPGGYRSGVTGNFTGAPDKGNWCVATQWAPHGGWVRHIAHDYTTINRFGNEKSLGVSVRCVKD